jgi:hypothetical protein
MAARGDRILLAASFTLFLLVGLLGESAAKAPLGPHGWAPGALPWAPGSATVTAGVAAAYILGGIGFVLSLRNPRPAPRLIIAALAIGALLTMPIGSADHTNYAAYGRILLQGGDPWSVSPIGWAGGHDPVTSGVQPPWQTTPSVYGPVAGLVQLLAAWIGGDNLRQVVWAWQWVVVGAWLAGRWLLRRLFPDRPGEVDALWTLNPLLVATGVLGAHVDLLATVGALAALLLVRTHRIASWALAGVAAGAAVGIKVTAGVVLVAVLAGAVAEDRRAAPARCGALLAGALAVLVPAHLWAGLHTYDQLGRSRRSISLATPWRKAYEWSAGLLPDSTLRTVIFAASALVCVLLAAAFWRVLRPRAAAPGDLALLLTLALSFAYAAGATYSLPWYDQLVWALLPAVLPLRGGMPWAHLQIARATVLALAYVPGRVVGMTPAVEAVTLGWRRDLAPAATLAVWLVVLSWAVRPGPASPVRHRRPR